MWAVFVLLVLNCLLAEMKGSPLLPGESFSTGHFEWKDAGLVSFPYIVTVEGNGFVSSVYRCPLSQKLGVWHIAQEGGMTV